MTIEHTTTINVTDIAEAAVICKDCGTVTVIPLTGEKPHKALSRSTNCICGALMWKDPKLEDDARREAILAIHKARRQPGVDTVRLRVPCDESGRRATGSASSEPPAD